MANDHEVLTIDEAAAFLRYRSRRTIRRLMATEGLPSVPMGGSCRFLRSSLIEWLENREVRSRRRG